MNQRTVQRSRSGRLATSIIATAALLLASASNASGQAEPPPDSMSPPIAAVVVAGGSISGVITRSDTGAAVSGATIAFGPGGGIAPATSAADGSYVMVGVPAGVFFVTVTAPGFVSGIFPPTGPGTIADGQQVVANVSLSPAGSIRGRVSRSDGAVVAGATVSVAATSNPSQPMGTATSAANGTYVVEGLLTGSYRVTAVAPGLAPVTRSSAVNVVQGSATRNINLVLTRGEVIGRVVDPAGLPVPGLLVSFGGAGAAQIGFGGPNVVVTGADGGFTTSAVTPGLPAGSYDVRFAVWVAGATMPVPLATAAPVTAVVTDRGTVNLGDVVVQAARVGGTVSRAATNAPANGVTVSLAAADTRAPIASATTGADGRYDVFAPPGTYVLSFSGTGYVAETFDEFKLPAGTIGSFTPVQLALGTPLTINEELGSLGRINGRISVSSGASLPAFVQIQARQVAGPGSASAVASPDGSFALDLADGSWTISVDARGFLLTGAKPTVAIADGNVVDLTIAMVEGGRIRGTVTDAAGQPIAGVAPLTIPAPSTGAWVNYSDAQGRYEISGLPAGDYAVSFFHRSYLAEYYHNAATVQTATKVTVRLGEVTVVDEDLRSGSRVSGTVRTPDGPRSFARVWLLSGSSSTPVAQASSGADGSYSLATIADGTYRVAVVGDSNSPIAFVDQDGVPGPDQMTFAGDRVVSAADILIDPSATMSGTVRKDGQALGGVLVTAFGAAGAEDTFSAADGTYSFTGLVPDTYDVAFRPFDSSLAPEYYRNRPNRGTATHIAVARGSAVTGIDAVIDRASSLAGRATGPTGAGIVGAQVVLTGLGDGPDDQPRLAMTAGDGAFSFAGLPAGKYRVVVQPPTGQNVQATSFVRPPTGSIVTVGVGAAVTGIDISMRAATEIALTITKPGGAASSSFLQGLVACRVPAVPTELLRCSDGSSTITPGFVSRTWPTAVQTGLADGDYNVAAGTMEDGISVSTTVHARPGVRYVCTFQTTGGPASCARAVPAAPATVTATRSGGGVTIVWADTAVDETEYILRRQSFDAATGRYSRAVVVATLPSGSTSLVDTPGPGVWRYEVVAKNPSGSSAPTRSARITIR